MKRLLVLRRLDWVEDRVPALSGGALKTFEYFAHARASGLVESRLMLFPPRPLDGLLKNYLEPHEVVTEPGDPDIILLSREWADADDLDLISARRTFIHFVQHPLHVVAGSDEYLSLARPAVRIAGTQELAERMRTFEHLVGEVTLIETAVSMPRHPFPWRSRQRDVVISGRKNPELARAVGELLTAAGCSVLTLDAVMRREDYLDLVATARVLVALPMSIGETAFLTALEGMYLDMVVVLPETFGPARYCIDGVTCMTTTSDAADIAQRTFGLLKDAALIDKLRRGGAEVANRITMANERRAFTALLARIVSGASIPAAANSGAR